ncbi:methylated-DNA--[protein]-cysteine S-methyltransferase [Lactococcus insecticola]|uniref:Methylated-DNA--protein-cysteine methyltransferase n=1 Tax=Pseudolactococcus insecticola TaxID=2709158 RepID=A0A6A0B5A7_9LACT|nr:methylated-DNA--[protein]-cysteine S-methyltransferase [Lactococcus insecticola]GFH40206.1 methylated-DNA--protein-cysteine methyltransferase [Lactococcus insecticola]
MAYYKTTYQSPLGQLTLASDGKNLNSLWFENQKYFGATLPDSVLTSDELPVFADVKAWLDMYFSGDQSDPSDLPLSPIGSDFRQEVWQFLREIPYGSLVTYGDIAKMIARKRGLVSMSAQAIGGAVGHNPLSIIVPCHRVVGQNGSLTGYAGGIDRKIRLLELEGVAVADLTVPSER